ITSPSRHAATSRGMAKVTSWCRWSGNRSDASRWCESRCGPVVPNAGTASVVPPRRASHLEAIYDKVIPPVRPDRCERLCAGRGDASLRGRQPEPHDRQAKSGNIRAEGKGREEKEE